MHVMNEHRVARNSPRFREVPGHVGFVLQVVGHLCADDHVETAVAKWERGGRGGDVASFWIKLKRERIQIDIIYRHPDNQEIIDEYKRVLASCAGSVIDASPRARLMRLRTLKDLDQTTATLASACRALLDPDVHRGELPPSCSKRCLATHYNTRSMATSTS